MHTINLTHIGLIENRFHLVIQIRLCTQSHWVFTIGIEYDCFGSYSFIIMLAIYFMQNMSYCIRLATTTIPKNG